MSGEKEIFSKLSELLQLIDDHSKGKTIANPEKHHSKKKQRKAEYSDFSSILSGGEEESPVSHKQKNIKQTKKHSNRSKSQQISKPIQSKEKTEKSTRQKKIKSKSPKKRPNNIKVLKDEEEITEIQNNDLTIHRDNLHKIFSECKTLDSLIEASLSPKPAKTRSQRIQHDPDIIETPVHNSNHSSATPSQKQNDLSNTPSHSSKISNKNLKSSNASKASQNSQDKKVSSAAPSKTSQNSQNKNLSSTPSFNSSNNAKEQKEPVDDRSANSRNSKNVPPSENDIIYSTSSQVFVIEQATQTQLSSDHHSNSYESSKNNSNVQHLLDIDANLHNEEGDINFLEEEEEIDENLTDNTNDKEIISRSISQNQNQTSKPQPQKKQIKQSPEPKNQNPKEEVIIFEQVQTRSIELNEKEIDNDDQNNGEDLSSEGSFVQPSSNSSSSDLTVEAINSNSSDENAGKIIQSPIKMKPKKQLEYLDPIIEQTDSESEKKKQKPTPPRIIIPESKKLIKKNKKDDIDIIDSENRDDILEILATSSSSDEQGKSKTPPNIIFSSSTTPKSAKTPEYLKPVFSSESESKQTTDTDKEKEEKESKPVPIYSKVNGADDQNEDAEEEKAQSKDLEYLRNKVIDNNLLDIIQSSESIDEDKDLVLLHTTSSSEGDY